MFVRIYATDSDATSLSADEARAIPGTHRWLVGTYYILVTIGTVGYFSRLSLQLVSGLKLWVKSSSLGSHHSINTSSCWNASLKQIQVSLCQKFLFSRSVWSISFEVLVDQHMFASIVLKLAKRYAPDLLVCIFMWGILMCNIKLYCDLVMCWLCFSKCLNIHYIEMHYIHN